MKSFTLLLGFFVASAYGKSVVDLFLPEVNSAYGYMTKYGIPRAEELLKAEKEFLANQNNRIINGSPSALGQYPWQAGLFTEIIGIDDGRRGVCGGSLISNNRVLTAAHCWFDGINQAWRVSLTLGSTLLSNPSATVLQSTDVTVHPNWVPYLIRNDVAIIKLNTNVQFSDVIAPISLPSGSELSETFVGETAIVSGFGLTSNNGGIQGDQFLSHVEVPIISNSVCRTSGIAFLLYIQDSNICSSGINGNGPCQGDSGGPLVIKRGEKNLLIGVVSFGSSNGCESTDPAAYARTTSFIDFINNNL